MRTKRAPRRSVDQDGVVEVELRQGGWPRWIWISGLVALVALVGILVKTRGLLGASAKEPRGAATAGARSPKGATAPRVATRSSEVAAHAPPSAPSGPEATEAPDGQEPDTAEGPHADDPQAEGPQADGRVRAGQAQAGQERTGIDLFPAPGTKRI